jgi:hypothetical protein
VQLGEGEARIRSQVLVTLAAGRHERGACERLSPLPARGRMRRGRRQPVTAAAAEWLGRLPQPLNARFTAARGTPSDEGIAMAVGALTAAPRVDGLRTEGAGDSCKNDLGR